MDGLGCDHQQHKNPTHPDFKKRNWALYHFLMQGKAEYRPIGGTVQQ
jgi:hypothetical protein